MSETTNNSTEFDSSAVGDPQADTAKGPAASAHAGNFQATTIGFFEGVGRRAWEYADAHPHAVLYGLLGLVLAILVLTIGLWATIVIALFVSIGMIIGHAADGNNAMVNFLVRLMNRQR